jgi:predicted ATPase
MLRRLSFTNFKSWPHIDLECGKLTGLFGPNSSGKTSILQFLLLLKQTKDATDRQLSLELNGDYIELGSIEDAIYRHDRRLAIDTSVTLQLPATLTLADPSTKSGTLAAGAELTLSTHIIVDKQQAARTTRISYELGAHQFKLTLKPSDNSFELKHAGPGDFRFLRTQGRAWGLPPPIKSYAFPDQARTYFQNAEFLSDLEAAYEAAMDGIFYLGPLRDHPQRDYLWARSRPTDVGSRGEKTIDAILAATANGTTLNLKPRARYKPFQEVLAYWLQHLGLIYQFRVEEIARGSNRWQAKVVTSEGGSEVLLTDVGFGISQVLPVITLLLYVPQGSTVLLEQPEIHLHPLAQANLADVLVYAAKHRGVQVLLESHSEHLLLRLQRRIAEQSIQSDEVKLYFCDIQRGSSVESPLRLDSLGQIENWPKHFMGDAFGETAAAERARIHRLQGDAN